MRLGRASAAPRRAPAGALKQGVLLRGKSRRGAEYPAAALFPAGCGNLQTVRRLRDQFTTESRRHGVCTDSGMRYQMRLLDQNLPGLTREIARACWHAT